MNARRVSVALAAALVGLVALAGCMSPSGAGSEASSSADPASPSSQPLDSAEATNGASASQGGNDSIEVDEGLLSVDVRLPRDLFLAGLEEGEEFPTQEELQKAVDDEGLDAEVAINDDGSVTYTMSRAEYENYKRELKVSIDEQIQKAINEEANIYRTISYEDDLTAFDVVVNRKALESSFSFLGLSLLVQGSFYQAFTGVEEADIFVVINYIDEKSGEVFDTYDSRDLEE